MTCGVSTSLQFLFCQQDDISNSVQSVVCLFADVRFSDAIDCWDEVVRFIWHAVGVR